MKLKHKLMCIAGGALLGFGIFYKGLQMFQYAGYVPNDELNWFEATYAMGFLLMCLSYTVILIRRGV